MTDDLVAFLRARLDEDEGAARAIVPKPGDETAGEWVSYPHQPNDVTDIPGRPVAMVGCIEPDGREWIVAEAGQWDRSPAVAAHIARHDPARVLAEVAAKRAIIAAHHRSGLTCPRCSLGSEEGRVVFERDPCETLRLLASPYADHPDFDATWAVDTPQ